MPPTSSRNPRRRLYTLVCATLALGFAASGPGMLQGQAPASPAPQAPVGSGGSPAPEDKAAFQKDCSTFAEYCKYKYENIRRHMRRGEHSEALRLADRLKDQETRWLERLSWYYGRDRAHREKSEYFKNAMGEVRGRSPQEIVDHLNQIGFVVPPHFANPELALEAGASPSPGSAAPPPPEHTAGPAPAPASTNYGVERGSKGPKGAIAPAMEAPPAGGSAGSGGSSSN